MKEINSEFLRVFSIIMARKRRPLEETLADMELLYSIDAREAVRLAFASIAYARGGCMFKKSGVKKCVVDVYGLRNIYEGTGMVYWLMVNKPKLFYSNLYQLGTMFGGWKELITVWELDIKRNDMKLEDCSIQHSRLFNVLIRAILDKDYGPDAIKVLPNIRRNNQTNTVHRKCRNIIGKYMRSRMPRSKEISQNRYYKSLKRSYRKKLRYQRLDMGWLSGMDFKDAYLKILNQPALNFINNKYLKDGKED